GLRGKEEGGILPLTEDHHRRAPGVLQTRYHAGHEHGGFPHSRGAVEDGQARGIEIGGNHPLITLAAEEVVALRSRVRLESHVGAEAVETGGRQWLISLRRLATKSSSGTSKICPPPFTHTAPPTPPRPPCIAPH